MNKVYMGKNKSHVSYASTKIDLKSYMSIHVVSESAKYYIIDRLNFLVKVLCGIRNFSL